MNRQEVTEEWNKNPNRVFMWQKEPWRTTSRPCVIREFVTIKVKHGTTGYGRQTKTNYREQLGARIQYWEPNAWKENHPDYRFTARTAVVPFRSLSYYGSASIHEFVRSQREWEARCETQQVERQNARDAINQALTELGMRAMSDYDSSLLLSVTQETVELLRDAIAYRATMKQEDVA